MEGISIWRFDEERSQPKTGPGRLESEEDIFVFALFFFRKIHFFGGICVGFTAELLDEDILNPERIQ